MFFLSYLFDAAGNVTSATNNSVVSTYSYDATNQLLGDGSTTVTYDATGNRNNGSYVVGTGNEMSSDANYTYNYDNEGNMIEETSKANGSYWLYSYDNLNHLTEADQYNSGNVLQQTVVFKYDAFGNRIEKDVTVSGTTTTTRFALDGWNPALAGQQGNANWGVWGDLNSSDALLTRYLRGDQVDQLFARTDSGTAYWELTDSQGSIRTVLDDSANIKDQITYDGWGNATQTNSTYGGRYLYTGREFDSETGLQYNRARYYDPGTGRWLGEDPLGFGAGDSNLYRYARNEPLDMEDPSGDQSLTANQAGRATIALGVFGWGFNWALADPASANGGWVLQRVSLWQENKFQQWSQVGEPASTAPGKKMVWWEVWNVAAKAKTATPTATVNTVTANDIFSSAVAPPGIFGFQFKSTAYYRDKKNAADSLPPNIFAVGGGNMPWRTLQGAWASAAVDKKVSAWLKQHTPNVSITRNLKATWGIGVMRYTNT